MNRAQFMEQLEKLLSDISEEERLEALDYYNSYFDDAGEENEAEVIQELGSPGKVAAIIKADLKENSGDYGRIYRMGLRRHKDQRTRTDAGNLPGKEKRGKSFQPGERSLWLRHRWKNLRKSQSKSRSGKYIGI